MDKEAIKTFLVSLRNSPEIAELMMREAEGLEAEGWSIDFVFPTLVFTTPTLTWWGNGVSSSSRYRMAWRGVKSHYGWEIKALDRKPHWPSGMQHPNVGTNPCMGRGGGDHISLHQPNPFVAARSIASMISGYVLPQYAPERYGDVQNFPTTIACGYCGILGKPRIDLIWRGSQYYHINCYRVKKERQNARKLQMLEQRRRRANLAARG